MFCSYSSQYIYKAPQRPWDYDSPINAGKGCGTSQIYEKEAETCANSCGRHHCLLRTFFQGAADCVKLTRSWGWERTAVCPCIPQHPPAPGLRVGEPAGVQLGAAPRHRAEEGRLCLALELTDPRSRSTMYKLSPHLEKSVELPKNKGKVNYPTESSSSHVFVT